MLKLQTKKHEKKSDVSWSLDKTGDRKWKKNREKWFSDAIPPTGEGWEIPHNSSSKNVRQILNWFKNNDVKARKCHINNDFEWIFLFYSFFEAVPLRAPRNHCYLIGLTFWNAWGRNVWTGEGAAWVSHRKQWHTQTSSFLQKRNLSQKQSLYIAVSTAQCRRRNQDIWSKRKEGIIKIKFLHFNGITSAPSAIEVGNTTPAGTNTLKVLPFT